MRRTSFLAALVLAGAGCRQYDLINESEWGGQEGEPATGDGTIDEDPDEGDTDSGTETDAPAACNEVDPVVLFVSPDDSNSMASPVLAREAALSSTRGFAAIRPWEFLNYYDFAYPPAAPGELRIIPTLARDPASPDDTFVLQVAVASETVTNAARRPMNLTFVVDTSCSMGGDPIDTVRDVGDAVAGSLHEGDVVSLVTWNTDQNVLLRSHLVTGPSDPDVRDAFRGLSTSGGTDLHGGLVTGYALAEAQATPDRINRVVLISDGGANLGVTDADLIGDKAGSAEQDGIYLVGVGVGTAATYNDDLMDTVTDLGKGAAVFIPDRVEAERIFSDRFVETFDVAARNVRIRLDLPPSFEVVRFSGEQISTNAADVDPQHLAPNDTMVLQQALKSCAAPPPADDAPFSVTVTWQDPRTFEAHETTVTSTLGELSQNDPPLMAKATAILAYADLLRALDSSGERDAIAATQALLNAAVAANPDDEDLVELQRVLNAL